ncbi:TIGR01906 family membrane protein [Lachnotalea glycerini]|uniref:TIGR01906 family membrane protein n=1 Tax=Lachnotalea glycerini TaxID=1763509 RepID=A0A371J8P7_9FIRM|nr:TIGR01906 family membrane protein [Lachnotalea glycerini]RDY29105.1 TIGR01906 family membrane protein [Lachnotalea glycerini]
MNKVNYCVAILGSIACIIILFLTSFKFVLYSDIGFYEKEYTKYGVLEEVKMDMQDVLYVTQEMMNYLIDKRDNLVVETVVDGQQREFFNEREKLHMQDVKNLFMAGLMIRRIAFATLILSILILIFRKADLKRIISRAFQIATLIVGAITGVAAFYISRNFIEVFLKFHYLFFDNDYWILNPKTDLMINILPEGFFYDTIKSIGIMFGCLLGILLLITVILDMVRQRRKQ